jgi:hypothetical protein
VRAYDTVTGLEEANTEAQVRIVIDADGADVTGRPNPPNAVGIATAQGGGCRVYWAYRLDPRYGTPEGFSVKLAPAGAAPGSALVGTVPYVSGQVSYSWGFPGPFAFATYTAVVASYNATGTDGGTAAETAEIGLPSDPLLMEPITARVNGS